MYFGHDGWKFRCIPMMWALNARTAKCDKILTYVGFGNVFRLFVSNLARKVGSMTSKFRMDQPKQFVRLNNKEGTMITNLLEELISQSVLESPYIGGCYALDTNACDV